MEVQNALHDRRSYRALDTCKFSDFIIHELATAASLAPSCFNNQPWRFVFVSNELLLKEMHSVYSPGNEWASAGSGVIAVLSKKELDCIIGDRLYYQFDTGIAVGLLMLRAVELGLVTHAIAGFNVEKTRKLLAVPQDYDIITLIIVGAKGKSDNPLLTDAQKEAESVRPQRKNIDEIRFINKYSQDKG